MNFHNTLSVFTILFFKNNLLFDSRALFSWPMCPVCMRIGKAVMKKLTFVSARVALSMFSIFKTKCYIQLGTTWQSINYFNKKYFVQSIWFLGGYSHDALTFLILERSFFLWNNYNLLKDRVYVLSVFTSLLWVLSRVFWACTYFIVKKRIKKVISFIFLFPKSPFF